MHGFVRLTKTLILMKIDPFATIRTTECNVTYMNSKMQHINFLSAFSGY